MTLTATRRSTLGAGVLLFGEVLSSKQALGLVFAIVGVVLLSF